MSKSKFDIILLSNNKDFNSRCYNLAKEFGYTYNKWDSIEILADEPQEPEAKMVILSTIESDKKEIAAEYVQVSRQICPSSFIVCIVSKKMIPEDSAYVKKCGADVVLLEEEVLNTSKLEFFSTQVIKANFLPLKTNELFIDSVLSFDLFHLLPQRRKFLPCGFNGDLLTKDKYEKLSKAGELYLSKDDADNYKEYSLKYSTKRPNDLIQRCRAVFLSLYVNYVDLILILTDQSEHSSFTQGNDLLQKCKSLSNELIALIGSIGSVESVYNVINNSVIGEFGSLERAPAVAAYAALIGMTSECPDVEDIMLAAILSDLGLVFLSPSITKKIREDKESQFTSDEREDYEKYPKKSLNIALERKFPVHDKLRKMMLATHEYVDGSGFPNKLEGDKVPLGAQIINFSNKLDRRSLLRLGEPKVNINELKNNFFNKELLNSKYSLDLISKIKAAVV